MNFRIIYIFILLSFFQLVLFAQDTSFTAADTVQTITALVELNKLNVLNPSVNLLNRTFTDTMSRYNYQMLPVRSLEETFNYLKGGFLRYMDIGQIQNISFDQLDYFNIGIYRNDRLINDLIDGTPDLNIISKSDIKIIENSELYPIVLHNYSSAVKIHSNEIFQYKPYSEINYQQDRDDNLFVDVNYHQNLSQKFNFNIGITKHVYTGNYINAEFDKWLGRFNFNYFFSRKALGYLKINYLMIDRDLNEGLNLSNNTEINNEILFDPNTPVVNAEAYEVKRRFDVIAGLSFAQSKNSHVDFKLFVSNSLRHYADRLTEQGVYIKDNFHWINYGSKISLFLSPVISRTYSINTITTGEINYDVVNFPSFSSDDHIKYYLFQGAEVKTGSLFSSVYIKIFNFRDYSDKHFFDYGIQPGFTLLKNNDFILNAYGSYSKSTVNPPYLFISLMKAGRTAYREEIVNSYKAGLLLNNENNKVDVSLYFNKIKDPWFIDLTDNIQDYQNEFDISGINLNTELNISKFNLKLNAAYLIKRKNDYYPELSGIVMLSYKDRIIKNKLEILAGVQSRFWTEFRGVYYNSYYNIFSDRMNWGSRFTILNKNATLDVFITGRLERAVIGFVAENLINIPYITTAMYPMTDRGGFANVLSRFTLTWFLLN